MAGRRPTTYQRADEEELAAGEDVRGVPLFRAVPDRRELQRLDFKAALLERFLDGTLRCGSVHVGPAARQSPTAAVGDLPHHQNAVVVVKDSGADVHLGGRITGLAGEQRLDPFDRRVGAGREHAGGELAYDLVALAIVRVATEREADPMFQEADQPILADSPEEILDVGVKYPVHFPYLDRRRQRVQRIVRPSPGSKPIRKTTEVAFIDGVERDDGCALYDLIFQGGDRERPLLPIGLRYVRPARRLRSIGSPVDPSMQILDTGFEVRLVVMPRYAIHAGGGFALKRVKRRPERVGIDVVEERSELCLLPLPCGFPYAVQRLCHARPTLSPVRALLIRVPLGPRPWLHRLRSRSPGFVRRLRSYSAGV